MPWMTVPIALAIGAGGATAGQIYATRTAGKQNRRAMEASERSDVRAETLDQDRLKLEREDQARRERLYKEAVQLDRERWQDYLRINEPIWRQGAGVLENLYGIAGAGGAPTFQMPTAPGPGPAPEAGQALAAFPRTPVSTTMPVGRSPQRLMPTMPFPAQTSPWSSLQSLLQLAEIAGPSKMPRPTPQALSTLMGRGV